MYTGKILKEEEKHKKVENWKLDAETKVSLSL